MSPPKVEQPIVLVITDPWKRLVMLCQTSIPFGDITVRIVNGSPTDLLAYKRRVRFDRPLPDNQILDVEGKNLSLDGGP